MPVPSKPRSDRTRRQARPALEPLETRCLPAFGTGGIVTTALGSSGSAAGPGLILPNGDLLAGSGAVSRYKGTDSQGFGLVEYTPSGALDTTFGTGGTVITQFSATDDAVSALALQGDKVIAAGIIDNTKFTYNYDILLARYTANGTLDTTFGNNGKVTIDLSGKNDGASAVLVQPDGKIVVAGSAKSEAGLVLLRYTANGSLDSTFGAGGKVIEYLGLAGYNALALQSDGKIVAGGYVGDYYAVGRYNANGTPDTSFGQNGKVFAQPGSAIPQGGHVTSLAFAPGGKIITATSGGADLRRLEANGALDVSFGGTGIVPFNPYADSGEVARSLALQDNGKVVVAGLRDPFGDPLLPNHLLLARYNADGSPDLGFGSGGAVTTAVGDSSDGGTVRVQGDGKVVVFGSARFGGVSRVLAARYNADGSLDAGTSGGAAALTAEALPSSTPPHPAADLSDLVFTQDQQAAEFFTDAALLALIEATRRRAG